MTKILSPHHIRTKNLQKALKTADLDAIIIQTPYNVSYFCGFEGTYSVLIVDQKKAHFFTDARYTEIAEGIVKSASVSQQPMMGSRHYYLNFFKQAGYKSIGFETSVSVGQLDTVRAWLRGTKTKLKKAEDIILGLRAVKDVHEIKAIRKSAKIADQAMAVAYDSIGSGITEQELSKTIRRTMEDLGAKGESFENIVASGPNSSRPHHHPGKRRLKSGDMITIDLGAYSNGYCSDMTRNPVLGKCSKRFEEIYDVCLTAQKAAVEACRVGMDCKELDGVAREIISMKGFGEYFGHGLGHGVGMEIHEGPRLSPRGSGKLVAGNVVTVEPGIYIPGFGGVRIEDLIVVTEKGPVILSKTPKDLTVLPLG